MSPRTLVPAALLLLTALLGAGSSDAFAQESSAPAPGTLAYDKGVWITLLRNHTAIRREVRHLENGVEAVTESDDPAIAELIRDHALAMKHRMSVGARVRVWDPVFLELFEHADKIQLRVTTTDKGVSIVETSDDPHTVMLLRSHAAGLSDFVREGTMASGKATPYWTERTHWTPIDEAALSEAQRAQRDAAVAARDAMFAALLARLESELASSGPAGAITVCKVQAPQIAAQVAEDHGVLIGRTSDRLRNPANRAPEWAEPLLADHPAEPRYTVGSDGSLGVTLPIRLGANCLACHGAEADLAPETRAALAEAYPADRATGFQAGDLRGWFWVQAPPTGEPAQDPAP